MKLTPEEKEHARALKIALRDESQTETKKLTLDERIAESQRRDALMWKLRGVGYGARFGSTFVGNTIPIPMNKI